MKRIGLVIVFSLIIGLAYSQQNDAGDAGMKTYYLVFLKKGPNRSQDSTTVAKIQEGHMAHLNKMAEAGKMDLAGPLMEDGDLRGICVYNTESMEECRRLVNEDPAIKAGRLVAEIHPWYSQKGACLK